MALKICGVLFRSVNSTDVPHSVFLKPKLNKESKSGFKTINYWCYPVLIFSKNWFRSKKIIKKVGHFVDFWIFMAIYMDKLDQFRKFNCRTYRIRWNITKTLKTEQFFSWVNFYLWKAGVWGLEKPIVSVIARKHLIKNDIWNNCSVFNILVIFHLILNVLQLNFLKLV